MTIQEVISNLNDISENATVFAKSIDGEFRAVSPVALVRLSDDEKSLPTNQISELKCPGYEYFMEVFLIKEFVMICLLPIHK
ncbi:MAG: hypothetical protein ACRYFK_16465 [Janthinobacterium lividum]